MVDTSNLGNLGKPKEQGDPKEVQELYDKWAKTYNDTLEEWNYDCPKIAAQLMKDNSSTISIEKVLDVGCGTGLTGIALKEMIAGITSITGLDFSPKSLDIAQASGAYTSTVHHSLADLPLPLQNDEFDGLTCVGVFTYIQEHKAVLQEFCRVVKPKGILVFTQRDDHCEAYNFGDIVQSLVDEGYMTVLYQSHPMPYLPAYDDYGDKIKVLYFVCQVN